MENLSLALRRAPIRLAIVVLLSLVVAGACYGVSLTPVGQSLVGSHGGPPAGRGAGAPAGKPQVSATAPADPATSTDSGVAAPQAAPARRPVAGADRPRCRGGCRSLRRTLA